MLLICPVRPGDSNEELRYAIRSWETNLLAPEGLELMTVGYCPSWLTPDIHVEGNRFASVPLAVFDNIMRGSDQAIGLGYGDEHVAYMNDDFFCLDPMPGLVPVKRDISLAQHRALFPSGSTQWWPLSLDLTASWLAEEGFPHPWSFEVHRPLSASPSAMFRALRRWKGGMEGPIPQWRTVYGTLERVQAHPVADVKLGGRVTGYGSPWISTSDQSWRRYALDIQKRFQKPSRWEN